MRRDDLLHTLTGPVFSVCNYFLYGESIIYYFKHIVKINVPLLAFARHHRFVSFLLYVLGASRSSARAEL